MPATSAHDQSRPSGSAPPLSHLPLAIRVFSRIIGLCALAGCILFLTAGTTNYWEATAWLVSLFVPAMLVAVGFLVNDPGALAHRFGSHSLSRAERSLAKWFAPLFLLAFLVPGLDMRFRWSDVEVETVPKWLALFADGMVVVGILFGGYVLRVAARVYRSGAGNHTLKLMSQGPYHIIRHPLYAASLLIWLPTPVALGSWVALPVFLIVIPFYVLRLRIQERALMLQVPGYANYCKRTPFRLLPFIW